LVSQKAIWHGLAALLVCVATSIQAVAVSQTITFDAIPNQIFGTSPFPVAAQASSGLPVAIVSTTPAVCKTASVLVTVVGVGMCSITASQGGNASFSAAPSVTRNFTVSQASPSVALVAAPGSPFDLGSTTPRSMVVGDFSGFGVQDLATANFQSANITVLLGNSSGSFSAAAGSPFGVGSQPDSVAVGDFNGDGIQDLAAANYGDGTVTVLLGTNTGGFTAAPGGPFTVGMNPSALVVGDFNGDGIQDLATANSGSNNVTVLLGTGLGGFAVASGGPFTVGTNPSALVVADFNGDGFDDLALANSGSGNVTVLLGNGTGGFTVPLGSPFTVGTTPSALVVADFNGDGKPDLAVANVGSSNVTVLLGNGTGGFAAPTGSPFPVGSEPYSIVAGDFNGDGFPDLATANYGNSDVTVLQGNGHGAFASVPGDPFTVGSGPVSLVVGEFSGSGIVDLATANYDDNTVTVLMGTAVAPLTIGVTDSGNFAQGLTGGTYNIVVTNSASSAATGLVTVTDAFPITGLTLVSVSGSGWSCSSAVCSRSDILHSGDSYPPITVTVNINSNAPSSVTNQVSLLAGISASASKSDVTSIGAFNPCDLQHNGNIGVADVQTIIDEVLGTVPAEYFLSGSSVADIVDVQIEINAALGLGCAAK
jgi:hypothetical protein